MIKPSGDLDAGPHKRTVLCLALVCVFRHLCKCTLLFMWVSVTISFDVILPMWDCWCVGVCYQCPQITDASKMFPLSCRAAECWQALLDPKTTSYLNVQKSAPSFPPLDVKTLYQAMNKYSPTVPVTKTPECRSPAALHIWSYTSWAGFTGLETEYVFTTQDVYKTYHNSKRHSGVCMFCSEWIQEPSI